MQGPSGTRYVRNQQRLPRRSRPRFRYRRTELSASRERTARVQVDTRPSSAKKRIPFFGELDEPPEGTPTARANTSAPWSGKPSARSAGRRRRETPPSGTRAICPVPWRAHWVDNKTPITSAPSSRTAPSPRIPMPPIASDSSMPISHQKLFRDRPCPAAGASTGRKCSGRPSRSSAKMLGVWPDQIARTTSAMIVLHDQDADGGCGHERRPSSPPCPSSSLAATTSSEKEQRWIASNSAGGPVPLRPHGTATAPASRTGGPKWRNAQRNR